MSRVASAERATSIPHSRLRRRIADHMVRSKATSAHVYTSVEVDFEELARVRTAAAEDWRAAEDFGLSYLPFVCVAIADGAAEYPHVNASWTSDELVLHPSVNIAVAVDLDFEGLIAPVVHDAGDKDLRTIARELHALAGRARASTLSFDDVANGTITVTSLSRYDTEMTLPIINQPQVAIIALDGVKRRPLVITQPDGSESIEPRSVAKLTLAWDHRAFDGAYAATFLTRVRDLLQTRDWAALL